MAKMKHSEVAARLAIEGAVSAIGGTARGQLGLTPRQLTPNDKIDLGMLDIGPTLYYELDQGGVLLQSDGAYTTIWFGGGDYDKGITALDSLVKKHYPDAKKSKDEAHATEQNMRIRTYDIKLPGNHLAIVDAIYPNGRVQNPKFMIRVTAMARQN
ncbi:MAG: hypothetical protein R3C30_04865 [Hyphomonadaceae bacterium]